MNIIVTLAEYDHIKGALVLYNSLKQNGFDGLFVIGYRNIDSLSSESTEFIEKTDDLVFKMINPKRHFTNYKPNFMKDILSEYDGESVTYIDPDIVVNCPADYIISWCKHGPSVCADVNYHMPSNHPSRIKWQDITKFSAERNLELYFNGGFLSVMRQDCDFLDIWIKLIDEYGGKYDPLDGKGDISDWRKSNRWDTIFSLDQDTLNIALMVYEKSIVTLGPDAMGFVDGGIKLIPHAIGKNKPWRRRYILDAIKGKPPRYVDIIFWKYSCYPCPAFKKDALKLKKLEIKLSQVVSRFIRKS